MRSELIDLYKYYLDDHLEMRKLVQWWFSSQQESVSWLWFQVLCLEWGRPPSQRPLLHTRNDGTSWRGVAHLLCWTSLLLGILWSNKPSSCNQHISWQQIHKVEGSRHSAWWRHLLSRCMSIILHHIFFWFYFWPFFYYLSRRWYRKVWTIRRASHN